MPVWRRIYNCCVRAPGLDYFDRYRQIFPTVTVFRSSDFPDHYQTYLYEDRSHYPTSTSPLRSPDFEHRYEDYVPVCTYS
jgi:hypothetical protein